MENTKSSMLQQNNGRQQESSEDQTEALSEKSTNLKQHPQPELVANGTEAEEPTNLKHQPQPESSALSEMISVIAKQQSMQNTKEEKSSASSETISAAVVASKIAELENQVAKYLDQLLRSQAELQNFKKRAEREISQVRSYANERLATELLAIKDSLEKGLQLEATDSAKELHEGLVLTLKLLQQIFERFGIEEINPENEVFNPERHQAMMTRRDASKPPNTVLDVLQKGYLMNGRLLRAAMVCVCVTADEVTGNTADEATGNTADEATGNTADEATGNTADDTKSAESETNRAKSGGN